MDIQTMIDALSNQARSVRGDYHVTLGGAIEILSRIPKNYKVFLDYLEDRSLGDEMSYRGYYSDLSFEPTAEITTVGKLLKQCENALGKTYQGYKGGDFLMDKDTPLWVSHYGNNSGIAIVDLQKDTLGKKVIVKTKQTNPY